MQIDEQALEVKSAAYADGRLEVANPAMANKSYTRSIKMKSLCFNGYDIEQAYEDGYRAAWEDKQEVKPEKEYYGL